MDFNKNRPRISHVQNMNMNNTNTTVEKKMPNMMDNVKNNNRDYFNQGEEWYRRGLSIGDAPEHLRKNIDFVNGYERERRLSMITNSSVDKTN